MSEDDGCAALVTGFVEALAEQIRAALLEGGRPPLYPDVVSLFERYVASRGSCGRRVNYVEEYQAVAKLAIDMSMEALSRHMESLDEDSYSFLSGVLTSYAVHIARLVAVLLDEAARLGALSPMLLEAAEPLVFVAAARMFALAHLVRSLPTPLLKAKLDTIKYLVDLFTAEDTKYLQAVYETLHGGSGAGAGG